MATSQGPLFPFGEPIAADGTLLVTPRWRTWLRNLRIAVDSAPIAVSVPPVLNQAASLPTTSMDGGILSAGLYAVSWYLSIVTTEPASTAQVTISWTDDIGARSRTATVVDGSVSTTPQIDQKWLIYSQAASPITYSVAYVGATMVYNFRPVLQSVATQ